MADVPLGPLAVSLGDPAGIGPEVVAKCWDRRSEFNLPPFVAIGDPRSIGNIWDGPIEIIDDPCLMRPELPIRPAAHVEGRLSSTKRTQGSRPA